jgi:hypothetical protein
MRSEIGNPGGAKSAVRPFYLSLLISNSLHSLSLFYYPCPHTPTDISLIHPLSLLSRTVSVLSLPILILSSPQIGGTLLSAPSSLAITSGLSGSALEIAANSMLPSCACDIERSLDILCNALEAVTADTHARYNTHTHIHRERRHEIYR